MSTQLARIGLTRLMPFPKCLLGIGWLRLDFGLMSMLVPSILAVFKHRGRQTEEVVEQKCV